MKTGEKLTFVFSISRQFKRALGKDQYEKVKQKGVFNAITEECFR